MPLSKKTKDAIGYYGFFAAIGLIIVLIFIVPVIIDMIEDYQRDSHTITNREYQEFQDWNNDQKQKEFEQSEYGN